MRHTASARQHGRLAEGYLLALVGNGATYSPPTPRHIAQYGMGRLTSPAPVTAIFGTADTPRRGLLPASGCARTFIASRAEQAPLTSPTRAILPHLHRDHLLGVVDGLALLDRVGQLLHFGQKLLPFR